MKNLLRLSFLFFVVATIMSCDQAKESDLVKTDNASLYLLTIDDGKYSVEPIAVDAFKEYAKTKVGVRGSNPSTNGIFSAGDLMCTFSAMENNSGVHGNSHLSGDAFWMDVRVNSDCITVIDNIAFWGGECTKWEVGDDRYDPIGLGWILVLSVKDNGEGNDSDPDEIGTAFIVAPPGSAPSDFQLPFDTWCDFAVADYDYEQGDHGHGYLPGQDPTNIQVK
jgi:hypothetical protein